jgi:hypothetical protein
MAISSAGRPSIKNRPNVETICFFGGLSAVFICHYGEPLCLLSASRDIIGSDGSHDPWSHHPSRSVVFHTIPTMKATYGRVMKKSRQ